MKSFIKNKEANTDMVIMAIVAAVVIAISLVVIFPLLGNMNTASIDTVIQDTVFQRSGNDLNFDNCTPAANATNYLTENLETFYSISPIYIVVLAAVGIIGAIMMIVVTKR